MRTVAETLPNELGIGAPALERILLAAPDAVIVMDADGVVRFWNPAATAMFGFEEADALGQPLASLIIPERFRAAHTERLAAFRPGAGSTVVDRVLHLAGLRADGAEIDLELKIVPVLGPQPLMFVGYLRDVTKSMTWGGDLVEREHELRDMAERMRALLASLPYGVLLEDQDRRLLLINDAMFRIFEVSRDDARDIAVRPMNVGARFAEIFVDPEGFLERREAVIAAQEPVVGERFTTIDGGVYTRDFIPIRVDGEYRGHIWLWHDVSVVAEEEAARERALESERIARQASEEQLRIVEELDKLRTEFLAGVSHELRTPLTTVLGYAEILQDDAALTDEQREMVDAIARSGDRLLQLASDLLLLARLESQRLAADVEPVDLVDLCRTAVDDARKGAEEVGVDIEFTAEAGPPLHGNRVRLRQLVDHLLSATVRLASDDGRLSVVVHTTADGWAIEATIPATVLTDEVREKMLRPFAKSTNESRAGVKGTRLSLPIAQAVAEMHGGALSITSGEGIGTTVSAHLPDGFPPPVGEGIGA